MARRSNDIPDLIHILTVATSAGVTEHAVREKLRPGDVYEDWEGSPGVLRTKARELRAELIAERDARQLRAIMENAEIDRRKRAAMRESAEAGRRQRESQYLGPRVSAPGAAPEPWMDEGDDE